MRTITIISLLLALGLAGVAGAQPYQGPIVVGGSSIQTLTLTGAQKYVWNNPGSAIGMTMDLANNEVLFSDSAAKGWLSIDVTTGTVTTILTNTAIFDYPTELVIDQNGDHIMVGAGPFGVSGYGIYKVSGSTITTITTTLAMGVAASFTGGLEIDIDSGNLLAQLYGGSAGPHPLLSIAADGTFTTITPNTSGFGARFQFTQDIRTGDLYVGSIDSGAGLGLLLRVNKSTGAVSTVATNGSDKYCWNVIHADRASSSLPQLFSSYLKYVYFTDLKSFTVTSVATSSQAVSPRSMEILGSRNLQTVRTATKGAGAWDIQLNCPHHPSKAYLLGMTLSGVRPGVTFPDGRTIFINPDLVTVLTVNSQLPGIFSQGSGILDPNGTAVGKLNMTAFPKLGLTAHIIALVLDKSAYAGIGLITDPYVIQL